MCRSVHDEIEVKASPQSVYDAYMDSRQHAKFTGAPVKMSRALGGRFTAGGDYITGYNLELVPGKRIVQAWRGSDWPEGEYSLISLELRGRGKRTKVIFDQRGIPDGAPGGNSKGAWAKFYWKPLVDYFETGVPNPAKM
jgi:uncharacterized protein YndB with AHSA1/START domain